MNPDLEPSRLLGARDDPVLERSPEEFREDGKHVKSHGRFKSFNPSGKFTTIRFLAVSISTHIHLANGIRSGSSPFPTSTSPYPPASALPLTAPNSSPVAPPPTSQPI